MPRYYVHDNQTEPGSNHEVHAEGCQWMPKPENRRDLGECADEVEAVAKARELFADADGCAHCCTEHNEEPADRTHAGR